MPPPPSDTEKTTADAELQDLSGKDRSILAEHEVASARLVHEIIRQRGIEELERPFWSLLWSAIGAGFVIGLSPYAMGVLAVTLPAGTASSLWLAFGYTLGFVLVIAGRMQLFTESTVTAVLPAVTTPTWNNTLRTLRLWGIVLAGNLIGTLLFGCFVQYDVAHQIAIGEEIRRLSAEAMVEYSAAPFSMGVPAGFMLAALVWSMTNLKQQEIFAVILVTWFMSLAGVAHSVVGSAEMWVAVLDGQISLQDGLLGFLLPAALGNLVGGAGLFALLAHAQVKPEIGLADERDGHR